jgi:hypothetical protein
MGSRLSLDKLPSLEGYTPSTYNHYHPFTQPYIEKLLEINDYRINSYIHLMGSLDHEIKDISKEILLIAKKMKMLNY